MSRLTNIYSHTSPAMFRVGFNLNPLISILPRPTPDSSTMPPKPFPFPLSVGSDICSMERIGSIVHAPTSFNRFARRVFTRLEWPSLLDMISKTGAKHLISNRDYAYRLEKRLPILYLPTIDISNTILTGEEKSNEGELVRYLAGR